MTINETDQGKNEKIQTKRGKQMREMKDNHVC